MLFIAFIAVLPASIFRPEFALVLSGGGARGIAHIPVLEEKNGILYLNPGSISIPKGGFPPSYAIWDNGLVEVRNLNDDSTILSYRGNKE